MFVKSDFFKKMFLLLLIAGLVCLFFALGLQKYLTMEFVKASQERFQEIYSHHSVRVIAMFVAFYIPVIALNLPGATILGLAAGAMFGALTGTVIISFASTIGATLACLVSRYLFREWVQKKFSNRLERINEGIRKEGAFYLFSMRLIPVIPFFVINMVMGLTPMRLRTFYRVSQLGMLPGTFIYVNAGSRIAGIDSPAGIISPGLIGSLVLLGLFPLITKKLLAIFRRSRFKSSPSLDTQISNTGSPDFISALTRIQKNCTDCGACKSQCGFLKEYGTPSQMLSTCDFRHPNQQLKAFECSLCNMCKAVCPEKLDPGHLFFLARKEAVSAGYVDFSRYKRLLAYEKKGNSPLFSWYGLPEGCDTVFFPGCTLPGTRSRTTWQMFNHLQKIVPSLGVVLDCCNKISHDLGRQDHFESMFTHLRDFLEKQSIQKVLVACPNCYKMFNTYGDAITVETVWEVMDRHDLPDTAHGRGELRVHDPCPLRQEDGIQNAVRSLASRMGMVVEKIRNQKKRTLCCGEGGSVGCVRPDLARTWGVTRQQQAESRTLVTYCAGCAGFLGRLTPTIHLADLIFDTQNTLSGSFKAARAPFTYLHRIRLKNRFKKHMSTSVQHVRASEPENERRLHNDECTLADCTDSLRKKGLFLFASFVVMIGLFFLIRQMMYVLDPYFITAEFHVMFIKNNLVKRNIGHFAEYFSALGPLGSIPYLLAGAFFETITGLWQNPVLYSAMNQAFGTGTESLIYLICFGIASFIFYGTGRFFLGDILPIMRKTKAPLSQSMRPLLGILLVIPNIPVALPAIVGALTRIRLKTFSVILVSALFVRVVLLNSLF